MNPKKILKNKGFWILACSAAVALVALLLLTGVKLPERSPGEVKVSTDMGQDAGAAPDKAPRPAPAKVEPLPAAQLKVAAQGKAQAEDGGEISDPRLANITVIEWETEAEKEEPLTPEEEARRKTMATAVKPLKSVMSALSSFTYKGEMKLTVPTLTQNEEAFKAGQRYGEGIEVTSSFELKKAEDGSYYVKQESHTAKGDTKYDTPEYNGELYYIDGEFTYIGSDGSVADDATLSRVLAINNANDLEPLVRKNWIQIIKDMDQVMGFDSGEATAQGTTYAVTDINPEKQKGTVEISSLSGTLTVLEDQDVMTSADISGAGQLKRGYMSGADIAYTIKLDISDVGQVETISPPQ